MHSVTSKQLKPRQLFKAKHFSPLLMASVSSSLRQQATAVVNQQLLSLCRWQKLCQLLLSISQVSLISQHLTLHLSVEQSPCKNKSKTSPFVAKEHLGCTTAIYFPTQNAPSFPEMKNVMWPAAGAEEVKDHAKQRERRVTTNFCFVWLLWLLLCGCLGLGHSGLSSCTQCFIGAQPGIRAGAVKPHKEPNRWHLSSQHTELGMAHFCDILVTAQSHEDDRCHPNHYRAVFQWLQTQSKAIDTQFWVCKWSNSNQRQGDCTFQSAPLAALSSCAWLCIQAGRAGRTWWPRLLPEASTLWPTSFAGAAQLFPLWTTEGPKTCCGAGSNPAQGL